MENIQAKMFIRRQKSTSMSATTLSTITYGSCIYAPTTQLDTADAEENDVRSAVEAEWDFAATVILGIQDCAGILTGSRRLLSISTVSTNPRVCRLTSTATNDSAT